MTDFTIKVKKVSIPCHKLILAATSPFFKTMFNLRSSMKENLNNEITLDFLNPDTVLEIVSYFYTGRLNIRLDQVNVYLDMIEYFQLVSLKPQVEGFMLHQLSVRNCFGFLCLAGTYNLEILMEKCQYILSHGFPEVIKHHEFPNLTVKQLIECILMTNEDVSQDLIMNSLVKWFHYNSKNVTKEEFTEIATVLKSKPSKDSNNNANMSLLSRTEAEYEDTKKSLLDAYLAGEKEKSYISFIAVGGETTNHQLNRSVFSIDITNHKATKIGKLKHHAGKYEVAFCHTPFGIMAIGGSLAFYSDKPSADCFILSVPGYKWTACTPAPMNMMDSSAVCVNCKVYVMGDYSLPKKMHCYNLLDKTWSPCPDVPFQCIRPIIAALKDRIYLVFNTAEMNKCFPHNSHAVNMCYYDTTTRTWTQLNPLPLSILITSNASMLAVRGSLYLLGGRGRCCARYTPSTDTWTVLRSPIIQRDGCSACYSNGKIVLSGGIIHPSQVSKSIEVYDIEEDRWKIISDSLPVPLGFHYVYCDASDEEDKTTSSNIRGYL